MCGKNNAEQEDEMEEACSIIGRDEKCIDIVVGKSEGKRTLSKPRHRW
jgi:hypothetical protein